MTIATCAPPSTGLTLDRKRLLAALERAQAVVPAKFCKPILTGVRLQAQDGQLHVAATGGEISFSGELKAEGSLAPLVAPCHELIRRLRASKEAQCQLGERGKPQRLVLNGGRVAHALYTLPVDDFPPVPESWQGDKIIIAARELHAALTIASCAMARDTGRYAINGVLLEADEQGVRLVATDGRRLASVELQQMDAHWRGQAILRARLVKLIVKFTAGEDVPLVVAVKANQNEKDERLPADLYIAGPHWLLSTTESEGRFPHYRDVVPDSHSRFLVDRQLLMATLKEVALASSDEARCVNLTLRPRSIELSASSPDSGTASAKLPARFLGGGDRLIHTGFNPQFLLEAAGTLADERIIIDVAQNGYAKVDGTVVCRPALLYGQDRPGTRWLVMPLTLNLPATREYLGSNYPEPAAEPDAAPVSTADVA